MTPFRGAAEITGRLELAAAAAVLLVDPPPELEAMVTAEDTERHKPEPDVFLEAARRLGVTSELCVVFEDTDIGLLAAKRAGMASVDVRTNW